MLRMKIASNITSSGTSFAPEAMEEAVFTDDKQTREANIRAIEEKLEERYAENEEWLAQIGEAVYAFQKKTVLSGIMQIRELLAGSQLLREVDESV